MKYQMPSWMLLTVVVEAAPSTGGVNTTTYFGNYQGLNDWGYFAFVVVDGASGTFIGLPVSGKSTAVTYIPDIKVTSTGSFSMANRVSGET